MIFATLDKAKSYAFKADAIARQLWKMNQYALNRAGAFVRTTMKHSIRPGGKKNASSLPGQPPRGHGRQLLRNFVLFDFEELRVDVIIGPKKLNMVDYDLKMKPVKGTIPQILEYGGDYLQKQVQLHSGLWVRLDKRKSKKYAGRPTRFAIKHMEPRPYARPALAKEVAAGTIPRAWDHALLRVAKKL